MGTEHLQHLKDIRSRLWDLSLSLHDHLFACDEAVASGSDNWKRRAEELREEIQSLAESGMKDLEKVGWFLRSHPDLPREFVMRLSLSFRGIADRLVNSPCARYGAPPGYRRYVDELRESGLLAEVKDVVRWLDEVAAGKNTREPEYLSPKEMLVRLPFKNPNAQWRRNKLAKIRKKCIWFRVNARKWVAEPDFNAAMSMLRSRALRQNDVGWEAAIDALPVDPTQEEIVAEAQKIKAERLGKMREAQP